jgi:hypothetical protein
MNIMQLTEQMERGQFTMNIPTSLALESLLGVHPEREWPSPPHRNYDEVWVNLKTLVRNIITSFPSDVVQFLQPGLIAELIHDEWNAIVSTITEHTKLRPVLYLSNYADLERRYNTSSAVIRRDSTPKQKELKERIDKGIQQAMADWTPDDLRIFTTDVTGEAHTRVIMMTHIPFDLVYHKTFGELDLLESHTGMIKNRSLWYTKFLGGKDLATIPFTIYFLRIFGDKEMFAPMDIKFRRALIELSNKYQWNALTTDARVRMCMGFLKNPFYDALLKEMMAKH